MSEGEASGYSFGLGLSKKEIVVPRYSMCVSRACISHHATGDTGFVSGKHHGTILRLPRVLHKTYIVKKNMNLVGHVYLLLWPMTLVSGEARLSFV